jgi:hypothetical protein
MSQTGSEMSAVRCPTSMFGGVQSCEWHSPMTSGSSRRNVPRIKDIVLEPNSTYQFTQRIRRNWYSTRRLASRKRPRVRSGVDRMDEIEFFGALVVALGLLLMISRHLDSSLRRQGRYERFER